MIIINTFQLELNSDLEKIKKLEVEILEAAKNGDNYLHKLTQMKLVTLRYLRKTLHDSKRN